MIIIQKTLKLKRSYFCPHRMGQIKRNLTGSSGAAGSSQSTGTGLCPDSLMSENPQPPFKCCLFTAPFNIQHTTFTSNHLSILCTLPVVSRVCCTAPAKISFPIKAIHPQIHHCNEFTKETAQSSSTLGLSLISNPAPAPFQLL